MTNRIPGIPCRIRLAIALALALSLLVTVPGSAGTGANAPRLLAAGQVNAHPTARWSVPRGFATASIEVSATRKADRAGFEDFVLFRLLGGRNRSWRSDRRINPGIYFVHVSSERQDCIGCRAEFWSNIRKIVIKKPRPFSGTHRGTRTSFRLTDLGSEITGLVFRDVSFRCGPAMVSGTEVFRKAKVRYDGADGSFTKRRRFGNATFAGVSRVSGRLTPQPFFGTPSSIATGVLQIKITRSPAGACKSGPIRWKAIGHA